MADGTIQRFEAYRVTNLVNGKLYIGITTVGIEGRWLQHLGEAIRRPKSALHRAIAKYGPASFRIDAAGSADSWDDLCLLERTLISTVRSLSPRGYNMTSGGDGLFAPSEEVRTRLSERNKAWWQDAERRAVLVAGMKANGAKPEKRAANAKRNAIRWSSASLEEKDAYKLRLRAFWVTPEGIAAKAENAERTRVRLSTPEARAAHVASLKAGWTPERRAEHAVQEHVKASTPEARAEFDDRMRAYWAKPGSREAMAEKKRLYWASPEARAAQRDRKRKFYLESPEARAAVAERVRAIMASPEVRAARGAAISAGHARRRAAKLAAQE